jgi:hypothetical protein
MKPADRLAEIGRALYGERWQKPLAEDLDVNRDTVRHWLSGHTPLREDHGVFLDALNVIDARLRRLTQARAAYAVWLNSRRNRNSEGAKR